jgi:large subunit ribosomal protein L10
MTCVAKLEKAVDRAEKSDFVDKLNAVFSSAGVVVVTHYSGLNVADMTNLRTRVREAGAGAKVVKNRLAKLAARGTDAEAIVDLFTGPTMIAYSDDPVAAPKVVVDFAKGNENLVVLGGAMGSTALDADGVKALASLPSLDELRAKLVGMISTPATRIATVLQAPASQVARVLGAYAAKGEAA